jgi:hypothetical protein
VCGEGSLFFIELRTIDPDSIPSDQHLEMHLSPSLSHSPHVDTADTYRFLHSPHAEPPATAADNVEEKSSSVNKFSSILNAAQVHPFEPLMPQSQPLCYHRALIVDDSHLVRKMLAKTIASQFRFIDHVCLYHSSHSPNPAHCLSPLSLSLSLSLCLCLDLSCEGL